MTRRAEQKGLSAATLRANPRYALELYERLAAVEREALEGLCKDPEFYGILRPEDGLGLAAKAVSCDTALLFATLQQSGPLPGFVARKLGAAAEPFAARLVLDGVLEIEGDAGFVSGAAAHALVSGAAGAPLAGAAPDLCSETRPQEGERLAQLSARALRHAAELQLPDPQAITSRLYCYNAIPASPRLRRLFPSPGALWAHLCPPGSPAARLLAGAWVEDGSPAGPEADPWRRFTHRQPSRADRKPEGVVYKLYVSAMLDALPEALGDVVEALTRLGVSQFKIGRDLAGVLRPDKLVAYFPTFEALAAASERLRRVLGGTAAQGVPFTAPIDDAGLLSWGMDPPPPREALAWMGPESWRLWVTRRLAAALAASQGEQASGAIEPWRFAVERVRLEGFDTTSWTPSSRIWKEAPGSLAQE